MKPPASSTRITEGSIFSISPTCPMSTCPLSAEGINIFFARMKAPSWPVSPTALPPAWLISSTTSLFTLPPSHISTTSIVSASVTRIPCTNSPFLPSLVRSCSICGPPPCTNTGFMPTSFSSTTSYAKSRLRPSSVIALPPYFTTMVLPWKRWMYGSASARTRAFSAASRLWLSGAFISRGFYKQKGPGVADAGPVWFCEESLLDGNLLALRRRLLGQRELEDAVAELGFGLRLVHFLRQRAAAGPLAERPLGMQHALVLLDFAFPLHFRGQGDLRAVD